MTAAGDRASVDDALSYLTHELRSPLTVILGYADLAVDAPPGEVPELLDQVRRAARDLERRLAVLADARDAAIGRLELTTDEVDLEALVQSVTGGFAAQLAPHPVEVITTGPLPIRGDGRRLAEAVTHLLANAARYSPADAPIEVRVDRRGPTASVTVRDHGRGVPPEREPVLFQRFARLDPDGAVSGVGLHLVRAIARAHGGDARYQAADGRGAAFTIVLPA